jgi:hypothetical protein
MDRAIRTNNSTKKQLGQSGRIESSRVKVVNCLSHLILYLATIERGVSRLTGGLSRRMNIMSIALEGGREDK